MTREHFFEKETFMGGWYIDDKICDRLISFFNSNKKHSCEGVIVGEKGPYVDKRVKDSSDLIISPNCDQQPILDYRNELQKVLENYIEKYPAVNEIARYDIMEQINLQYYPKSGGYKTWHCERINKNVSNRVLVFMTYLNDVEDGGTAFQNQNMICPAKKGLTIIWPGEWTHMHRGIASNTTEKYIITGWYSYV